MPASATSQNQPEAPPVGRGDDLRRLTPEEFRDIIGSFASGVTVITSTLDGEPKGTTASAVSSLSLEPPMVLVCLNKTSSTGQAVASSRRFAVNILAEDQASEAMAFARKDGDKFAGIRVEFGEQGEPLLADSLATLECHVVEEVTGGTHSVFFGEVERASAKSGAPLAYFRGQFGRLELAQDEGAFADIRAHILSRDIEIGQPLSLDDLAARFNSPRGPVYHALARLTGEGMVTRADDGSFIVAPLTLQAVREAWRARCAVELGVATLTVGKVSSEDVAGLRALAEAARPVAPEDFHLDDWLPHYNAFHEGMVAMSKTASLLDAYRRVNAPAAILSVTQRQMEKTGLDHEQCHTAYLHICDVVSAYEASDMAGAIHAILRHDEFSTEVAVRFMDSQGGSI
jgi:flavin reductase (DIM6/NTAB) family NADH-FMN oxidoreductase RutF/DNA-binding GntR family transcriptional regulator